MKQTFGVVFLTTLLFASMALPQSKTSKKTPSKKTTTSRSSVRKGKSSAKTANRAPVAARQAAPTPERYKEIQQALAEKGYLKSEPNGVWDAQSSAALAQFQNDRKLTPTGKLSSASLIALGLGPSTAAAPPADGAPAPAHSN
jgi:peptidoglycan hydrolase-like protein with peptidoglycan-binding domain